MPRLPRDGRVGPALVRSSTITRHRTEDEMPCNAIEDLPKSVASALSRHAQEQEICLVAFNNAWDEYAKAENRRGDDSRASVGYKVAWSTVMQTYEKSGEGWVKT